MENLLIFWSTPKEVALGWYIYLGIILVLSVPLVINMEFSEENKKFLAQVLVIGGMVGFFILVVSDVGLEWPDIMPAALEGQITPELLEGEKVIFRYGCANCHQFGSLGTKGGGPNLAGLSSRMTYEELVAHFNERIPDRGLHSVMPDYTQIMKPEELKLLLNFLSHL